MSRSFPRISPLVRAIRRLSLLAASLPLTALAQDEPAEDTIIVTSPRVETPLEDVAGSISRVTEDQIQLGQPQLTLDESLVRVPGVFMQNRHNFSQALRISIRGFGARGNFGIRGIKLMVDDVPATLPDGQGNVDEIDLGSAQRIEVLRGAASSLYGSASAGVISIYTEDGQEDPYVETRLSGGEYGYEQIQLKTGGQAGRLNYLGSVSLLDYEGYRANSYVERSVLNSKLGFDIGDSSTFTATINVLDVPKMGDPGALNATELATNRRLANPNSIAFDGSEGRSQERIGFIYRNSPGENHEFMLRNYYTWLDFENKLPVVGTVALSNGGQVEFERAFAGIGGQYTFTGDLGERRNRLIVGVELEDQEDDRLRYQNLTGGIRGLLTFDQKEMVSSTGLFVQNEFGLSPAVDLIVGLRHDEIDFEIEDHFLLNTSGNDSGSSNFSETSERLGLLWRATDRAHVYTNFSTAFDTPTTTEFANPAGGGFNPDLTSQTAESVEAGIRGEIGMGIPLSYDFAVFHITVDDELVPYEVDGVTGRTYYQNAAESTRDGFELALSAQLLESFGISFAYSDLEATFDSFTTSTASFAGSAVPGVPETQAFIELTYRHARGFYGALDALNVSEYYAENANAVRIEGYTVSNLRFGYEGRVGNFDLSPFIGVYNLLDEEFNSNVRINATFGRYYEPAPGRQAYAGVTARYSFR